MMAQNPIAGPQLVPESMKKAAQCFQRNCHYYLEESGAPRITILPFYREWEAGVWREYLETERPPAKPEAE